MDPAFGTTVENGRFVCETGRIMANDGPFQRIACAAMACAASVAFRNMM